MKRLFKTLATPLLVTALMAIAPTGFAQNAAKGKSCGWTKLGETGDFVTYIDYCKITSAGRYRFAWIMNDYKFLQKEFLGISYSSNVIKLAHDCQKSRSAGTALYEYHSGMGQGSVVNSQSIPENQWSFDDHPPGSIGELRFETVCK
jgi:hypothetical protein